MKKLVPFICVILIVLTKQFVIAQFNGIVGSVYNDINTNCTKDFNEQSLAGWMLKAEPGPFYAITDATGKYQFSGLDKGSYTVSLINIDSVIWKNPCSPNIISFSTDSGNISLNNDFATNAIAPCPLLWVDMSTSELIPCSLATYNIAYANYGTEDVAGAYIIAHFELDSTITIIGNTFNGTVSLDTSQHASKFSIDTLKVGEKGAFTITAQVNCNALLGKTIGSDVQIYPEVSCYTIQDSLWDGAIINVQGTCLTDSIQFIVSNIGTGNMTDSLEYLVYEDNLMLKQVKFKLPSGDSTIYYQQASGKTYMVQAQQSPYYYNTTQPQSIVEACGNNSSLFSLGKKEEVTQADALWDREVDCHEIIASSYTNQEFVFPSGIGSDKEIKSTEELEYLIYFQNTTSDTVIFLTIIDSLSSYLDVTSVMSGVSSDAYEFSISGSNVLTWLLKNINLPPSSINNGLSKGFLKFKVKQKSGNVNGTVITNKAYSILSSIQNTDTISTGEVFNTINNSILSHVINITSNALAAITIYPNPFHDYVVFSVNEDINKSKSRYSLSIADMTGHIIDSKSFINANLIYDNTHLAVGIYTYTIFKNKMPIDYGKLVKL